MTTPRSSRQWRAHVTAGSLRTLALISGGLVVFIALNLVLARVLGPAGFGSYAFAIAWVEVLALLAPLGLDRLLTREVSLNTQRDHSNNLKVLIGISDRVTLATSVAAAGLAAAAVAFLRASLDPRLVPAFWIAMLIVPLRALIHVRSGVLLGLDRPVLGTAATTTVYPALLLVMVATLTMLDSQAHTAAWVVTLAVGAAALTLFWASEATRRALGRLRPTQPAELQARTRRLLTASIPMMLITALGIVIVRADVITVGAVVGAEAAGVYFIASQLAFGLRFGMLAATPALSSVAASLHGAGARAALQAAVSGAARVVMAISGAAFLVLVLAGRQLLQLFGDEFTDGYPAMILLAGGTLLMMALGPVELLLMMTGHERSAALSGGFATVANLALNVTLVPAFGLEGAAAATAISGVAWVVVLNRRVVRHLGIHPGVLRLQHRRAS